MTEHEHHDDDPERLADKLDADADALQEKSDKLEDEITDAHRDWEAKRRDPGVPGADPPTDADDGDAGSPDQAA
jgi:hypothetical protein